MDPVDEGIGVAQKRHRTGERLEERLQLRKPATFGIVTGGFEPGVNCHIQNVSVPRTVIGTVRKR